MKSESEVAQSCSTLCDPWTVAYQASPSMEFYRQEYWSGVPFPSPGHLPDPGMEPRSPALQADALPSETPGKCSLKNILSVKHTSTDKRKERREEGRKRNKEGEKER